MTESVSIRLGLSSSNVLIQKSIVCSKIAFETASASGKRKHLLRMRYLQVQKRNSPVKNLRILFSTGSTCFQSWQSLRYVISYSASRMQGRVSSSFQSVRKYILSYFFFQISWFKFYTVNFASMHSGAYSYTFS